jgi:5-formyltetrahydrofolate cyclo-ligase
MPTQQDKPALRAQLQARRDALDPDDRSRWSTQIRERLIDLPEFLSAQRCFVYVSYRSEVATHYLIPAMLAKGQQVYVPKILSKTEMQACRLNSWDDLKPDRYGILAPAGDDYGHGHFDLVITPGLGFTVLGVRIGYGAGYYDRWLAAHPTTVKLALAFEAQIVATLPSNRYDVPVDGIVTETRLIRV